MFTLLITFLASFLIWFMFAGLVVHWFIDGKIKKEQAFHAFIAALIAWAASEMIKTLYPEQRPFLVTDEKPLTFTLPLDGGFPSQHTAAAFALAVTLWLHDKKIGLFYLVAALAIGIGRVLSNVHTPVDVLVGSILGSCVAYLFEKLHLYNFLSGKRNKT